VSNLIAREMLEVCALNPTDPARQNSCLSQQLDNLSSKPQLQRKTNWTCHWWILADAKLCLCKKKMLRGCWQKLMLLKATLTP